MTELSNSAARVHLPIISTSSDRARTRFIEFFAASIRNPNTRKAYFRAVLSFLEWADRAGLARLHEIQPIHVATWVEWLSGNYSTASVKQHLAAVKMLFDWMVVGQAMALNAAASVKSPRQVIRKGKTPVLDPDEARHLLDSIDVAKIVGLRDRALIGTMIYSFARIGAALSMRVDDVYVQNRRLWLRLHEKGGKLHDMPCHHELEEWLYAYIDVGRLRETPDGWLFQSINKQTRHLGPRKLCQANAYAMVKRRAAAAGITSEITNHSFRATGITAYLISGGTIEKAAKMANHASTRTTTLYDRREDSVALAEVERIRI
jgi:site-specific recombinase XerD